MEMTSWKSWTQWVDSLDRTSIMSYVSEMQNKDTKQLVEKEIALFYYYYKLDYLGNAQKHLQFLVDRIKENKNNNEFIKENKKGLNILKMGFRLEPDGCGGFDIFESSCGSDFMMPVCACCCVVSVIGCCGINIDSITTCDTTDGKGCCDNGLNCCCTRIGC